MEEGGLRVVCRQLNLNPETLRRWYIEAEVEQGRRPGFTQVERSGVADLERDDRELRRANEILKTAAISSGRSSTADRRSSGVHRDLSGPFRGRADLSDTRGRPFHLLFGAGAPALYSGRA